MSASPTAEPRPRRVVIADDEALIRMDLKEMLQEEGYEVVGEAATARRPAGWPRTYARTSWCSMSRCPCSTASPRPSGSPTPGSPRCSCSPRSARRELVERARDAGAMAYVVKPFTPADLVPAIEIAVSPHAEPTALGPRSPTWTSAWRFASSSIARRALQVQFGMTEPEAFRWIQKMLGPARQQAGSFLALADRPRLTFAYHPTNRRGPSLAPTSCSSRSARAASASCTWPSRSTRSAAGWRSRSSNRAWIPSR